MIAFKDYLRLVEEAENSLPSLYYHGTDTDAKAASIIKNGIQPDQPTEYKGDLRPVPGAVYLTASMYYAVQYVFGINDNWYFQDPEKPYGYLFVVDGSSLTDFRLDEDAFVTFLQRHIDREWDSQTDEVTHSYRPVGGDTVAERDFTDLILSKLTSEEVDDVVFTRSRSTPAKIGKKLQRIIPKDLQLAILARDPRIAHFGPVFPTQCWRIPRANGRKLAADGSNFFELAEQIPLS